MRLFRVRQGSAERIYLTYTGLTALATALVFSVNMVYQVQTVGLTPLQLVLIGTMLELSIFVFEVPTGVVADVYSRRLSVIIGLVLIGCGFMLEGAVPTFEAILFAQVLWGVGYTFTSGAQQAWITDEIGAERVGRVFLRSSQLGNIIGLIGLGIAISLGSAIINLPIIIGGALHIVLALWLILFMPETGFKPAPSEGRSSWARMASTFREGLRLVRARPTLLSILGIGLFFGLYSEGLDRLGTAHLLTSFTLPDFAGLQPVVWIGLISAVGGLLSVAATQVIIRRVDTSQHRSLAPSSYLLAGLLVASVIGFALAGSFALAVVFRWIIGVLRTLIEPLQAAWINQHIDSSVRATVISMSSQVDAMGQIAGGPAVGAVGNRSIRLALLFSGLILSPVLLLYRRVLRPDEPAVDSTVSS